MNLPVTTVDQLERRWRGLPVVDDGRLHLLVLRLGKGRHATPLHLELDPDRAILGDRYPTDPRQHPDAQVSLIERRVVEALSGGDRTRWTLPGDNLVVDLDLSRGGSPVGTRLRAGTAVIELTDHPHTGCAKLRARFGPDAVRWVNAPAHRERRLRGVYARIVRGGTITLGDRVERI